MLARVVEVLVGGRRSGFGIAFMDRTRDLALSRSGIWEAKYTRRPYGEED